jgi:hypothetical protein
MFRSKLLFDCLAKFLPFGHIEIIADERFELISGAHVAGATLIASSIASILTLPAVLVLTGG